MGSCCEDDGCAIASLLERHANVLLTVLVINAAMFVVEGAFGLIAHSTSLLADSLDMLGDALVYGLSLVALRRSMRWQASVALGKGAFMLAFGLGVVAEALYKTLHPVMPDVETMRAVAVAALASNVACFLLLYRHRGDNLNMSSTWLCSRNDLAANVGVLLAAAGSHIAGSPWPDVVVGALIAALFSKSAVNVLAQAARALRPPVSQS